jgi:hypothetical protein
MTKKLTLDEARAAVLEVASKVLDEPSHKERLAQATEESRASGIDAAVESAAASLMKTYDPNGNHPLPNAARAQLRNILDEALGIRAERGAAVKEARDRADAERAEKPAEIVLLARHEHAPARQWIRVLVRADAARDRYQRALSSPSR